MSNGPDFSAWADVPLSKGDPGPAHGDYEAGHADGYAAGMAAMNEAIRAGAAACDTPEARALHEQNCRAFGIPFEQRRRDEMSMAEAEGHAFIPTDTPLPTAGSIIGQHVQPGTLIALVSGGKFSIFRVAAVDHQAGTITVNQFPAAVDAAQILANMAPQPNPLMNPQIIDAIHDFAGPGELQ